jgi:hypothetical protein
MKRNHPGELELAWLSDDEDRERLMEHVRWCSSCHRILTDYEWLQGEIVAALDAEAANAPVAAPNWAGVRGRLECGRERAMEKRGLVAVGVALMMCVMLVTPAALGRGVEAQTVTSGGVSTVPVPDVALGADLVTEPATMLPATSRHRAGAVSLPFVPPPTPPDPEV